ncbi:DEAD/DEAH box helicase [Adhaeribacter arboris]|uniref:DEAD/DEAH box helicase n=1 Tax=Adhaeribacter arboris TaxID=2072846 RepID=A0A2T2YKU9_9BACT|nr:DEAD/DEAH box helicase [Adhaeribacter arboris]PSR56095.1 DEAD/DEAH box helicase [Adhaeribacter arboris]
MKFPLSNQTIEKSDKENTIIPLLAKEKKDPSILSLRPYQSEAILQLRGAFRSQKKKVILCLPTGAGKTYTFSDLAKKTIDKGGKVLILTHRVELLTQANGALSKVGLNPFIIQANCKHIHPSSCYVAMVETLYRRLQKPEFVQVIGNITLIIIDECHLGNFRKVLELFPDVHIIGATATPISSKKEFPLKDFFDEIIVPIDIPSLILMGFLASARTYGAIEEVSNLKTKMGEYTDASLMGAFDKKLMYDDAINHYKDFAQGRKAICFNINIEHSLKMRDAFRDAGIRCEHLDGEISETERKRILASFKKGEFEVLCNVGVLTTGFDEPSISCIIVNRATKSTSLYFQMCGRGSRILEGKEDFIIIDMGSNFKEHGLWNEPVNWKERFLNPKKPSKNAGVAPVKECPECNAIIPAVSKLCQHCGFKYTKEVETKELLRSAGFVEITPSDLNKPANKMSVREVEAFRLLRGYKIGWAVHQLRERGRTALEEYAQLKNYKAGWVNHQMEEEYVNI